MKQSNPLQLSLDRIDSNPLIAALPHPMAPDELAQALQYQPISQGNVASIPHKKRPWLIDFYKKIFVPTACLLSVAVSAQQLLHEGLDRRDPRLSENRIAIYKNAEQKGKAIADVDWSPSFAAGMVIEGITGSGKTQAIDRYLHLLPQVIEHEANPECGWIALKQLVWLRVHMPSDGSRGGFVHNGLLELDKALGTDYMKQYASSRWTVEKLLVVFMHLLQVHRCGLLVIEEAQEANLSKNAISKEFLTFFLRILNWGTPIILIGNPLAFETLKTFSQNVDRFSEAGWFTLYPVMDPDSEEWNQHWIPCLWEPTLLDHPDEGYVPLTDHPLDQTLGGFVWKRTAGVPRYLCRLRREVQRYALFIGATQVTASMVDEVYRTNERMVVLHHRIEALVRRDWRALAQYEDIPSEHFRKLWHVKPDGHDEAPAPEPKGTLTADKDAKRPARKTTGKKGPARKDRGAPGPELPLDVGEAMARKYEAHLPQGK